MKEALFSGTALFAAAALAAPVVSNVAMTQDSSRTVTVTYTLAEETAIVTCDIQTNGVSIGEANLHYFEGDCNKKVEPGDHRLTWKAAKSWPDHKITDNSVTAVVKAWSLTTPPDYMVVDLSTGDVRYYPSEAALPESTVNCDIYKTEKMAFRRCPAANVEWRMGTAPDQYWGGGEGSWNEYIDGKAHLVMLTNDFYIGVFPMTQRQYAMIWKSNSYPSAYSGDDRYTYPVTNISADNGVTTTLSTLAGIEFKLPLEAQWEFAARAGCSAELYNGKRLGSWDTSSNLAELGAHRTGSTKSVGSYLPNDWGIYDMLGNVNEYCRDIWVNDNRSVDPNVGNTEGDSNYLVVRGGSYSHDAYQCRVCSRMSDYIGGGKLLGLRLSCLVDAIK